MSSASKTPAHEKIVLCVVNESKMASIKAYVTSVLEKSQTYLQGQGANVVVFLSYFRGFSQALFDPAGSISEEIRSTCIRGATVPQVMTLVASINNDELKKRLAKKIKPFIVTKASQDVLELFEMTSFDDDATEPPQNQVGMDHELKTNVKKRESEIYYCKVIFQRQGNACDIMIAYLTSKETCPWWSARAFFRSQDDLGNMKKMLQAVTMTKIHQRLALDAPSKFRLTPVDPENMN